MSQTHSFIESDSDLMGSSPQLYHSSRTSSSSSSSVTLRSNSTSPTSLKWGTAKEDNRQLKARQERPLIHPTFERLAVPKQHPQPHIKDLHKPDDSKSAPKPTPRWKSTHAKFFRHPQLATPELPVTMTVQDVVRLAHDTAHLPKMQTCDITAIANYLEMLCFLEGDCESSRSVRSVVDHFAATATVLDLQRLCGVGSPNHVASKLSVPVAFSYVNVTAVREAFETIETDPPVEDLPFLSQGGKHEVHTWIEKLKQFVSLIRRDSLRRCLMAAIQVDFGGRRYPLLYESSPAHQHHQALAAEVVRLIKGSINCERFRHWCVKADALTKAKEQPIAKDGEGFASQDEQLAAEFKREACKTQFEEWLRKKSEEAQMVTQAKAQQETALRQREEMKEQMRLNAEMRYELWLKRVNKEVRQKKLSSRQGSQAEAKQHRPTTSDNKAAAEEAYQLWLRKVTARQLEEMQTKTAEAKQQCLQEKEKFKQSQRNFKLWLKRKSASQHSLIGRRLQKQPPWQDAGPGPDIFLLDEQLYDYLYQ